MSPQKPLFALCLVAGCLALAYGQTFDFQSCAKKLNPIVGDYQKSLTTATQDLVKALVDHGGNAADIAPFQSDIDTLTAQLNTLTNISDGVSSERLINAWSTIVRTQASMAIKAFQLSLNPAFFNEYSRYSSQVLSANALFFSRVTSVCRASF